MINEDRNLLKSYKNGLIRNKSSISLCSAQVLLLLTQNSQQPVREDFPVVALSPWGCLVLGPAVITELSSTGKPQEVPFSPFLRSLALGLAPHCSLVELYLAWSQTSPTLAPV